MSLFRTTRFDNLIPLTIAIKENAVQVKRKMHLGIIIFKPSLLKKAKGSIDFEFWKRKPLNVFSEVL